MLGVHECFHCGPLPLTASKLGVLVSFGEPVSVLGFFSPKKEQTFPS